MKKGFTLIELLGIIVIISIIMVISIPSLIGMQKKQEQKKYTDMVESILNATDTYVSVNLDKLPNLFNNDSAYFLPVMTLIDSGYIDSDLINPKTNKLVLDNTVKIIKNADGLLTYKYLDYPAAIDNYIQENLLIHLDAYTKPIIKNSKNYWLDLTTNENNCVLTNFSTISNTNGSYTFDGVDDTCLFQKKVQPTAFTITMTLTPENKPGRHVTFVSWLGYTLELNANNTISFGINQNPAKAYLTGGTYQYNQKTYITLTFDGTTSKIYVDDKIVASINNTSIIYNDTMPIISAIQYDVYKGKIHNLMLYNRALNENEIIKNYQVNKNRFGE